MSSNLTNSRSSWTREENEAFENALAIYSSDGIPWEKIAAAVPGRTFEEIKDHFEVLFADVNAIESGLVPLPYYSDSSNKSRKNAHVAVDRKGKQTGKNHSEQSGKNQSESNSWEKLQSDGDHRRGVPWSEEEHRLFLQGLDKYGRGDWRNISRFCVRSRTPSQVASHAQKFFKRMDVPNKGKEKSSLHDVTILDDGKIVTQQVPTTKQIAGDANSFVMGTGSTTVGTNLNSSMIDSQCNLSPPHGPSSKQIAGAANSFVMYTGLNSVVTDLNSSMIVSQCNSSTPQGPSSKQITGAANSFAMYTGLNTVRTDLNSSMIASKCNLSTPHGPSPKQMAGAANSFVMDTGLNTVGTDLNGSFMIDSQCNLSTPQGPSSEHMMVNANVDFFDPMLGSLLGISTSPGPSTEQISAPAGVSLFTPVFANQHNFSTPQEPIAEQLNESDDFAFCDSLFADEDDMYTPQRSVIGEVTGTAEGACMLNIGESSLSGHPDGGVHAPPTASQPIPEPVPSDAALPGIVPSPVPSMHGLYSPDYEASLYNSLDDLVTLAYPMPPSHQN
ncbi:hypothetical protein ACH5RR_012025 [Cinchona calisaya]|uniref:Uncharacterized protein n=1 Tax=Cinchona calisaya TaxID=153742 RepID=A0ABD3A6L5_9GENT